MYPLNAFLAGWISLALWSVPEFDYYQWWMAQHVGRIDGVPRIAGW